MFDKLINKIKLIFSPDKKRYYNSLITAYINAYNCKVDYMYYSVVYEDGKFKPSNWVYKNDTPDKLYNKSIKIFKWDFKDINIKKKYLETYDTKFIEEYLMNCETFNKQLNLL